MVLAVVMLMAAAAVAWAVWGQPRAQATDRVAQANLEVAAAAVTGTVTGGTLVADPSTLNQIAPRLDWCGPSGECPDSWSTRPWEVSVDGPSATVVGLAARSDTGVCWLMRLEVTGAALATVHGRIDNPASDGCTGTAAAGLGSVCAVPAGRGGSWRTAAGC